MKNRELQQVDVLILCGGLGTRLRSLFPETPKGLAEIGGQPFLDRLVDELLGCGFQRIILCVGHLKEQIKSHFQKRRLPEVLLSTEEIPLGTGGAVKQAKALIESNHILIMNGDSWCQVDLFHFYRWHKQHSSFFSMVLTPSANPEDYGNVTLDSKQKIVTFAEKSDTASGAYINAGIYLVQNRFWEMLPKVSQFSLEKEVFPYLIQSHPCYGFVVESDLWDIGTPDRYARANRFFNRKSL